MAESVEMLKAVAAKVAQLERTGAFDEQDMKYIRYHAYAGLDPSGEVRVCLRPEQVAVLFGVSAQTVREWCRKQKIICWKTLDGWWDVPLVSAYELKLTGCDFSEFIRLDLKKVDF